MLVYEKKVEEVSKIFGTTGNIPSDNDEEVTYKDSEGQEITPALTLNEIYLDDGHGGIIRKLTGQTINAFVDNVQIVPAQKDVPPVPPTPVYDPYLTFSSDEPFTISTTMGEPSWDGVLEYSTDTKNWTEWNGTEVNSSEDGKLYFRGSNNTTISSVDSVNPWLLNGNAISCTGNIETLLDYQTVMNGEHPQMGGDCYREMFSECTSLTTAPELPATTLAESCYIGMFGGCTSLTTAPELPATTLATVCYKGMFIDCTSLTTAPELPATILAVGCYEHMFNGCTSLTTAPELPATTLAKDCYNDMFSGCTSLTTAPELPATMLADYCYSGMFGGCTSLTTAPELPATILAVGCYGYMFSECRSLTTAPQLLATMLADYCYSGMFSGCTSIKLSTTQDSDYTIPYRIPTEGTGITAADPTRNMFENTGGTFTGTPKINTTYYLYDYSKDNTETIK